MPDEFKAGCQRPKHKPAAAAAPPAEGTPAMEVKKSMIKVGQKAPDFSASAFFKGKFVEVKLSE